MAMANATAGEGCELPRTWSGMDDVVVSGGYRALLLDQFGVLHDGKVSPTAHLREAHGAAPARCSRAE